MATDPREDDVPAGYRDADIESAELERLGRLSSSLKRRGICTHGWAQGSTCLYCGQVFPTWEALLADRRRAFNHA